MTWLNHRGERIDPHARAEAHPKRKKGSAAESLNVFGDPGGVSLGFVVLGYPASTPASIRAEHERLLKAAQENVAERMPPPFAEFEPRWYEKTKPQRIQRPFQLRQAAQQCAELAAKAGWIRVTVEELVKT